MANNHQARVELAEKLDITTQLLLRWALLADLMRIVKKPQYVNLLEEADVDSLEALRKVPDPCVMSNLLNQKNKTISFVSQTPSSETVQQWIQEARKTEPKVR